MKSHMEHKVRRFAFGAALLFGLVTPNQAALTDLADSPVASMATVNVLPNLMFVLDDSGSMQQDYTPDYVNDTMCYDALDTGSGSSITNTLVPCFPGDPVFMSPDFNAQYYSPEIYYEPPVDANGNSLGNQSPTSAITDPYGVQRKDMLQDTIASPYKVDLTLRWPDREWCDGSTGGTCVTNSNATGYRYPDSTYGYGFNRSSSGGCKNYDTFYGSGSKCINYKYGAPYYWRIPDGISPNSTANEYCTNGDLKVCSSTVTAFPSVNRWCTDYTLTNCQSIYINSVSGVSDYRYPRYAGKIDAAQAIYTITVSGTQASKAYSVSNIKITVGSTVYPLYSGTKTGTTSSSGSQSTRDNNLASTIKGLLSNASFTYSVSNNVITITAISTGPAYSGTPSITFSSSGASAPFILSQPGTNNGRTASYRMERVDIISSAAPFKRYPGRVDCVTNPGTPSTPGTCTYNEEIQNFANWFSYYRTRMQAMKSAVSLAFKPIDNKFRVGFTTINYTGVSTTDPDFLNISDFNSTQKASWYSKMQATNFSTSTGNVGTPLRTSLKKVGEIYHDPASIGAADPVQYECQQNFTLLTTDGYWNQPFSFGNHDNNLTNPTSGGDRFDWGRPIYDGGNSASSNTLSDVAMYYYKTDLRPLMDDKVFVTASDPANWQHMTTFTLGLGVSGVVKYQKDYETAITGDFANIKGGFSSCLWGSPCNWPIPSADNQTAVDDLWHAAVNGHGHYFSARDPAQLVSGLKIALSTIQATTGSAAAAATSSPNITAADNWIYITTYSTSSTFNDWSGEIKGRQLNAATGQLPATLQTGDWEGAAKLQQKISSTTDTRTIYTFNAAGSTKPFTSVSLSGELGYFSNKGSLLSQYALLTVPQKAILDDGASMIGFIRGRTDQTGVVYRNRQTALGDIVHSRPAYVRIPLFDYTDSGYAAYKSVKSSRTGVAYVGANDGMLHAFNGTTGDEMWAYVPKLLWPNLYRLAEKVYGSGHRFFVDGEPIVSDAQLSNGWRSILITGMGKGGRGFIALDVTDPINPLPLWEICHDNSLCAQSDSDMGYSFGNPVITKRASDGKWVALVTSGYNNTLPGSGKGYLYVLDLETGGVLNKVTTNSGDAITPSGLAKINAWVSSPQYDNTASFVYGGDLNGDLWRFDLSSTTGVPVMKIGTLMNASSLIQPVTTKPELVECYGLPMVLVGTGKLLGQSDLTTTDIQSIYGIIDRGTPYSVPSMRNAPLIHQTTTTNASGNVAVSNNALNTATANGWYLDLAAGERINVDPVLGLGTLVIAGNTPTASNPCQAGGTSITYQLAACNGGVVDPQQTTQGIKDASAMVAGLTMYQLASDGRIFVNRSRTDGQQIQDQVWIGGNQSGGKRARWRELIQ